MFSITSQQEEQLHRTIDRFWETIPPMWREVRGRLQAIAMEEYGVTVEQFHVLRHIRRGASSVSALAEVKQISRPAISQSVEQLVGKGLIERCQNTDDRRFVQLALTPSGNALLNGIFQKNRLWMAARLERLTPEELSCVLAALDGFQKAFVDPPPSRVALEANPG